MKKVTKLKAYDFDSLHDKTIKNDVVTDKLSAMYKLLDAKIVFLESRIAELKEAKEFLATGMQIYLFKNNDSNYSYIDTTNKHYEYRVINDKPVLIDSNFNLFEIIEYVELDDIGQDRGNKNCIASWIDKVVKVKRIGN